MWSTTFRDLFVLDKKQRAFSLLFNKVKKAASQRNWVQDTDLNLSLTSLTGEEEIWFLKRERQKIIPLNRDCECSEEVCVFVFICHAVGWSVTSSTVSCFSFTAHLNVGNMLVDVRNIYDHHCILFSAHLLVFLRGIHLHTTKVIQAANHIR